MQGRASSFFLSV